MSSSPKPLRLSSSAMALRAAPFSAKRVRAKAAA